MRTLAYAIALGLLPATPAAQQQPPAPAFQTTADSVSVEVSVRSGTRPVSGLTASDFEVWDNGVRQHVRIADLDRVPLDVTLIVDVSWARARKSYLETARADTAAIARMLLPTDRLRLMAFSDEVVELLHLQPGGTEIVVPELAPGQMTSLNDALVAALIRPVEADRRGLVIAFTDGYDNLSVLTSSRLKRVAERAEAVLHLALGPASTGSAIEGVRPSTALEYPQMGPLRLVLPGEVNPQFRETVIAAAEATGGRVHTTTVRSESIARPFRQIFEDYRSSYLLQYELRDVRREGWHDIKVQVTRRDNYTVRARRGYYIE